VTSLRSYVLLVAGAAFGGLLMGLVYGAHAGQLTGAFMVMAGLPVLLLTGLFARHRHRLGPLPRQFLIGISLVVGLALVGIAAIALFMFVSPHDAFTMALLLAFAGGLTGYCAWLMTSMVIRERDASESARRDLIAAVSHDLRTPLASLQVLAEAIEDGVVDDEMRRRYVGQICFHIRSLGTLIDDLFELSRLEAGEIEWSMQKVALDELVAETVEAMRAEADARQVRVQADTGSDLAPALANPEKLQRVLFNLIQNAIRHTPADGSVTVAAISNGASIEVEVADTGAGIAASDRERIFEPFFRGESSRASDGAGLGLTICRAIVEAHGGRIWVAGGDGGTRVRFSLPRASSPA
jgi:signal transduction histidine kinase